MFESYRMGSIFGLAVSALGLVLGGHRLEQVVGVAMHPETMVASVLQRAGLPIDEPAIGALTVRDRATAIPSALSENAFCSGCRPRS